MKPLIITTLLFTFLAVYVTLGYKIYLYCKGSEGSEKSRYWVGVSCTILTLSLVASALYDQDRRNPCVEYKTSVIYDTELEIERSAQFCVLRGKIENKEKLNDVNN